MRKTQRRRRLEKRAAQRSSTLADWTKAREIVTKLLASVLERHNPMLEITFRTDELTAREMHLAYAIGTNSDPLIQIELILLRAEPHELTADQLTKALWQEPASHVSALANAALVAATAATKAAMERAFPASTAPKQEREADSVFDEALADGLEM